MSWREESIEGVTADVYPPSEAGNAVLLFLHGHTGRTLRDNPVWTELLDRHGFGCVCPHGARCWWLDRHCSEFASDKTPISFLRESVVPWISEQFNVAPPRIPLSGVSMGGQGALQLSYRQPREFPIVAAISPAVDFQIWHGRGLPLDEMFATAEAARQATAILELHPLNWPRHQLILCDPTDEEWFESAERLTMKLSSMGIPHERDLETEAGGHGWEYYDAMAPKVMSFIAERLEK
ncbi:alpha/beta hydrolase-fold protein [Stratiformator vulcanicus]|uniref:Esterase n=1 Tax=Stratiformator vulcanicus TaxID=2527980 RepID=A0A517QXE6_9PLAN|nr:alpha/beta hydrolase-fold protein [Stratiformator vulcanicus]QDT36325.1 Putative esterase [Stratiformator vulcanicus]